MKIPIQSQPINREAKSVSNLNYFFTVCKSYISPSITPLVPTYIACETMCVLRFADDGEWEAQLECMADCWERFH